MLKSLCLLLLTTGAVLAQPNPDNMFIHGYVTDANGLAQANQTVCVYWGTNSPLFPGDTICTTTNSNGYYFVDITGGSVSGPNVIYNVTTLDPCSLPAPVVSVSNDQGTVDIVDVDFVICSTALCDATFTSTNDSINGTWTFVANATGVAPLTYDWWVDGTSYSTPTVSHMFNGGTVGVFLTVTDATGCEAMYGDTLYLNGPTPCGGYIYSALNPIGETTFEVIATGGTPPYVFSWSTGETTSIITATDPGVYCVVITDSDGCSFTTCDTIPEPNQGCSVEIITTVDSTLLGVVYTFAASSAGWTSYLWSDGSIAQTTTIVNPSPNGEVMCLWVEDANGCVATACDTLLPNINNGPCEAGFIYPGGPTGALLVGDTVQLLFDGVAGNQSTFAWTLSAGGFQFTATGMNPIFVLPPTLVPINGIAVEICVTVTDAANNCTDTYCQTVIAVPDNSTNCAADFTWAESNILGSPLPAIQFTDNSSNAGSWYWDFGDNTFSTDQNPIHAYNGTGIYTVCLTIVSADQSCQNTYCGTVIVGSNNGNCDASFSNSGPTPIGYTFSANVQDPNLYYYWEIDNAFVGDGYDAYAPGFTNGVHTICLTIIDSLVGCSDTQCLTITVGSPNCYGYISGQVYAGSNNQPLFDGVVYLITFDANTNQLTAVDSIVLDTSNSFFFGALACGDYMIKAAAYSGSPYYASHIPTYHGNSPFWGFAQTLTIAQANQQITADVTLIAANNPGGPGFIGGDVTEGANKTDPGDPLSGMQVMIFDLSGNAVTYGYTNANGEFGFSDLAWGTYQVYVEVLGVQTIPAVVTIGPDNPSEEGVHIFASETLISTGIAEFDFEGAISDVYPNPVVNEASISFNLDAEVTISISVVDLTGRMVSTETMNVAGGENRINVSAVNLKNGYYFLNIQDADGNFSVTRKFMRID